MALPLTAIASSLRNAYKSDEFFPVIVEYASLPTDNINYTHPGPLLGRAAATEFST